MSLKKITGTVSEVMECWPLELKLQTQSGLELVISLSEECEILSNNAFGTPQDLRPGICVVASILPGHLSIANKLEIV